MHRGRATSVSQASNASPLGAAGFISGAQAEWYDRAYDARSAAGHALRARMLTVVRLLGPGVGSVLDAGMGGGRLLEQLDRAGWTVYGIDASPSMVDLARRRLPQADARLAVGDIEHLPFVDATFDAVVATGVLEYSNVPVALAELARVLRPGGVAVVSYPNQPALYGRWKRGVFYPAVRAVKRLFGVQGRPEARGGYGPIQLHSFRRLLEEVALHAGSFEYVSYLPLISPLESILPAASVWLGERLERRSPALGRVLATQIVFSARHADGDAVAKPASFSSN
jgi:ubiquinone/menaquinone biosynthesis C-methylase UbiE